MKQKHRALVILVVALFVTSAGEILIFGRPMDTANAYTFGTALLTVFLIYWWYVLDKRERQFPAGMVQNVGIIFLSPIALPVYLIRSRGWGKGLVATLGAVVMFLVMGSAMYLGELMGRQIAF